MKREHGKTMLAALVWVALVAPSIAQEQFVEMLRSDFRADKVAILTVAMDLSEEESKTFWPIHREYDLELAKLGDRRLALLKRYGENYESISNDEAEKLVNAWFTLQVDHTKLDKKYYGRIEKALSTTTAARFIQVEHQIRLFAELSMASEVPLVKPVAK